ncbi:MAG: hypothetical protein K2M97_02730 [Muribaculaceae bacterium]|nr:hypothetical protein [Muribaculaceae bacterium]
MDFDFATAPWWMIWLAIAIVLAMIEVFTSMAVALCLAVGSCGALICALLGYSLEAQVITMAALSLAAFVGVTPLLRHFNYGRKSADEPVSNMDALIGRTVTGPADGTTRVRVDGDRWQYRSADGSALAPGSSARIVGYDSIVLLLSAC